MVFLVIAAFLILQIPSVQTYFIKKYLGNFSGVIGFRTTVRNFSLLWFDRLELQDVSIYDPANNKMIAAEKVVINFKLSNLFEQQDVNIDGIAIEKAGVLVTRIPVTDTSTNLNINVFVDRINEHYGGSGGGRNPRINIGEAVLYESQFSYIDQERDSIRQGFNYNQFTLDIDESQLQNFLILGDTTEFNVKTMLARDKDTGFSIRQLSTFFRLCQKSMEFTGLHLQAGKSTISDTILFTFDRQRDLSDFVHKVQLHANLSNTILQPEDLALFAPDASRLTQPVYVSGVLDGRIDNFRFNQMEVGMGRTILRGSVDMEGLPDINETFIILGLKDSRLEFTDFSFVLNKQVINRLIPVGRVSLEGEFLGYPNDFVAKGEFVGELGKISSDINFKVNEKNFDRSEYSGKLKLEDFDLGSYLSDTINFQHVDLSGNVKGSGLTLATADFRLNGTVQSIGIRRYDYKNISTNARFASELFNGLIRIDDPNLQLEARGSVDLRKGTNTIRLQSRLDTAFLHNLNLSSRPLFLHGSADVDVKGLHLDSIVGTARLKDFRMQYNDTWLTQEHIEILSERNGVDRRIQLKTNLLDADVNGNFLLSDITRDIQTLVKEMALNIRNEKDAIDEYYRTKKTTPKSYQAGFRVDIHDVDPIVRLFNIDLSVSDKTMIDGRFTSGYTSILQAFTRVDSVSYNNSLFLGTEIDLTASKIADSTSVLAMAFVNSERQVLTPRFSTRGLVAEAIWNNNHIDFSLDGDQVGQTNNVRLKGAIDFEKDSTHLRILPSTVQVLEKVWSFDPANHITLHKKDIIVRNFRMQNGNQFIAANGIISPDPDQILDLDVNDVDLSLLNPITGREFLGTLNAQFAMSNYYEDPFVQNDINIDSLTVDNFLVGDLSGQNHWDTLERKFNVNLFVDRFEKRIVNLVGFYTPSNKQSPLDVHAKLDNANLNLLEPFLEDVFEQLDGVVTGDYRITGRLQEPAIDGEGRVSGTATVGYLRTTYRFEGIVGMSPYSIYFKNIEMSDLLNNKGTMSGTLTHRNFYSMRVNLDGSFANFHVLNTSARDNSLFYGQGYATGDVNIFGPISNLKITANARTDRNTRISIPFGETSEVEKKEFIKFVSFTDSTFQQSLKEEISRKLDLTGITMDFNLAVTPDAYCEIIFDIKAGDIIRGRGTGDLQFQLDTKGEFNMFGPFEFTEGWYNFTLYDIINKDFEIEKGSRINWYGDPYAGILDISATYNQLTAFGPILTNQSLASHPQMRRKYPVQVLLELDGPMLSPQINFDIVTSDDLPKSIVVDGQTVNLDFDFQAFKNRMDEQELKRQVFSLIVLRRFSPPESFNTSGSLANSVSELLSNQLSNWISQVDENLEIDVDLSTFDTEAFNTFQLRLSYTFLNGRLRITRDATTFYGQNNTGIPAQQQNNLASIAGDWTVDYLLTADGKLRVKMYNRTNINPILNTLNSQNSVTTGVSISHTQSFNALKDLWKAVRKKKEKRDSQVDANQEAVKNDDDGSE